MVAETVGYAANNLTRVVESFNNKWYLENNFALITLKNLKN